MSDHRISTTTNTFLFSDAVRPSIIGSNGTKEQRCFVGDHVEISWRFKAIEKPRVIWYRNDKLLEVDDRIRTIQSNDNDDDDDDDQWSIVIDNVKVSDSGVYLVRAINSMGQVDARTSLLVTDMSPVVVEDLPSVKHTIQGTTLVLSITILSVERAKVIWMRNENLLVLNETFHVKTSTTGRLTNFQLILNNLMSNNKDRYSALVTSLFGETNSTTCVLSLTGRSHFMFNIPLLSESNKDSFIVRFRTAKFRIVR